MRSVISAETGRGASASAWAHGLALLIATLGILGSHSAWAQSVSFHPDLSLLDADGQNVLLSGKPVSTIRSCGECHDTAFVARHSFHADLGFRTLNRLAPGASPYDRGMGLYGRFEPNLYQWFEPGKEIDAEQHQRWLQTLGRWHVGGGPAAEQLEPNCFLCHLEGSDNPARLRALDAKQYEWAATATLAGSGAVLERDGSWAWNPNAFDSDGSINQDKIRILDPSSRSCGQCHGLAVDGSDPVQWSLGMNNPRTELTGEIFAAQRLYDTRMNLSGKRELSRPWDVHAERLLDCSSCHHSPNNPVFARERAETRPDHLAFDALKLSIGEYLRHPNHQLVKGDSSVYRLADGLDGTMRRCEDCHNAMGEHDWLPRKQRHFQALSCEACHLPRVYAPARMQTDWTVLSAASGPAVVYRGVDGDPTDPASLVTGYQPVLLRRSSDAKGAAAGKLVPHNLVSTFYWVGGEPEQPVPLEQLRAAFFDDSGRYHADVLAVLDLDKDGELAPAELRLDSDAKTGAVRQRLEAAGVSKPRIVGEVQPYSIHHGAAGRGWAIRDCESCHNQDASLLSEPMRLAAYLPGNVQPSFVGDSNANSQGELLASPDGALAFRPERASAQLYVFGFSSWPWVDRFGLVMLVASFLGIVGHAGLRVYHARLGRS